LIAYSAALALLLAIAAVLLVPAGAYVALPGGAGLDIHAVVVLGALVAGAGAIGLLVGRLLSIDSYFEFSARIIRQLYLDDVPGQGLNLAYTILLESIETLGPDEGRQAALRRLGDVFSASSIRAIAEVTLAMPDTAAHASAPATSLSDVGPPPTRLRE
jgi:hypothetical protein